MNIELFRKKLLPTARSYKWEIAFQGYEDGQFFPAHVVNDTAGVFNNAQIEYGPWQFSYPEGSLPGNLDISVYELNKYTIRKWLDEWRDQIADQQNWGVGLLGNIGTVVRQIDLHYLNIANNPVYTKSVLVIPDGQVQYELSSEKGSNISVNMSLIVVGT